MSLKKTVLLGSLGWIGLITGLHAWLNLGLFRTERVQAATTFKVGFLPVT